MESINIVVLSGKIVEDAVIGGDNGPVPCCTFAVATYHPVGRGAEKKLVLDVHEVILENPGTVMRYLKEGKPVTIQGRHDPAFGGVRAVGVHFP